MFGMSSTDGRVMLGTGSTVERLELVVGDPHDAGVEVLEGPQVGFAERLPPHLLSAVSNRGSTIPCARAGAGTNPDAVARARPGAE